VRLGFYQPDIPQNLGANFRLAACLDVALDIIEPCGFPLTDRSLRRAAMDYGERVRFIRHASWSAFLDAPERSEGRLVLMTTGGEDVLGDFEFAAGDTLLFGRESAGVPLDVHNRASRRVRIPLAAGARSLNVSTAAGIALFEALRQTQGLPRAFS
jgi:tRNA (cytidine/uridine-2'-O-)-methyltransferase